MNNLVHIGMLVLSLVFGSCGTVKNSTDKVMQSNRQFEIISATYSFSDSDSVNEKRIDIRIAIDNPDILLDSIYFRASITKLNRDINSVPPVFRCDFLFSNVQRDYNLDSDPQKEYGNTPLGKTSHFPFDLQNNEAVISYLYEGERQFYKIDQIAED